MPDYILTLAKKDEAALAPVRCYAQLEVAVDENYIWIKGINSLLYEDSKLKRLPVQNTYIINEKNLLFNPGSLTPTDTLKELQWQSLSKYIKPEAPTSAMPGKIDEQIGIRLVPSNNVKRGEALLTSLEIWKEFAETAAGVRLDATKFAVSEKNEVVIIGNPLPPLPGREFWNSDDILIPSGYEFESPILSQFIKERINKAGDAVILFSEDGNWQRIDKSFFMASKRSAIRMTNGIAVK